MSNNHNEIEDCEQKSDGIQPSVLSDLLCCPFCGGEGRYFCWDKSPKIGEEGYSINCEDCEVESPIYPTMDEAKQWWNRRAT